MQIDVVRELIDRILAASSREGTFTESMATEIERSFRRDFKGASFYVGERDKKTPESKKEIVVSQYLSGKPVETIAKENGISRATLYRCLKR